MLALQMPQITLVWLRTVWLSHLWRRAHLLSSLFYVSNNNYGILTFANTKLYIDPPQVFPLSQTTYFKNESDSFTVECQAFGIPPPVLLWIPGPLNVTLSLPGQNEFLVQSSDIESLINISRSFRSRFLNNSHNFCSEKETKSLNDTNIGACNQRSQTAMNSSSFSCPVNTLCDSVPCALDISTSTRTHTDSRQLSVSRLTICELAKMDEGALTCVAVNNISNVVNTPEASSANLIVQGTVIP